MEVESRVNCYPLDVLADMLDRAAFAILLLTGEDPTPKSGMRARQNVVHELGLFRGRLGFDKVVLIRDIDIEPPTNIDGWQSVILRRDNIPETLRELEAAMRKAGLLHRDPSQRPIV